MQLQPSSSQIPEFSCRLRCSVANSAEPAVYVPLHAVRITISGFSGDDTVRLNVEGFPLIFQLLARMSAGLVITKATTSFQLWVVQGFLDAKCHEGGYDVSLPLLQDKAW